MKNIIYILLVISCIGCNIGDLDFDSMETPTIEGTVAVPLGRMQYTMRELIDEINDKQLELTEDSTSLLLMTYRDTAEFATASEIIEIENINNTVQIIIAPDGSSTGQRVTHNEQFDLAYPSKNGEQLDSIFYKSGSLNLSITKTFPYDVFYTMSIWNTKHEPDNSPIVFDNSINSMDLADYKTILFFENDSNRFTMDLYLVVDLEPGQSLSPSDRVTFELIYSDQTFDAIYGKFGQDTVQVGSEVLDVGFFENLGNSGLEFGSPEISFHLENGFGLRLGLGFDGMYGVKGDSSDADTIYLAGKITESPQVINGASSAGNIANTTIKIDNKNSTLKDFLGSSPNKIGFNLSAISNPTDATAINFLLDDSKISTIIEMNIPMELSMKNLTREIKFDNGGGLKFDQSDSMIIRVSTINELPFSAALELEIRGENDSLLHTIAKTIILDAPLINSEGIVREGRTSSSDFFVSDEGIAAFNEGKQLVLKLTMNTSGNSPGKNSYVKVLANYKVDLQVSAIGSLIYPIK